MEMYSKHLYPAPDPVVYRSPTRRQIPLGRGWPRSVRTVNRQQAVRERWFGPSEHHCTRLQSPQRVGS